MTWSDAVDHMKGGGAVCRPGWCRGSRINARAEVIEGVEEPRWIYELHEGDVVHSWDHIATSRFIEDWEVAAP